MDIPYDVVQKIVELLYLREVKIPAEMEPQMMNALHFLRVDLIYTENLFGQLNGKIEKDFLMIWHQSASK